MFRALVHCQNGKARKAASYPGAPVPEHAHKMPRLHTHTVARMQMLASSSLACVHHQQYSQDIRHHRIAVGSARINRVPCRARSRVCVCSFALTVTHLFRITTRRSLSISISVLSTIYIHLSRSGLCYSSVLHHPHSTRLHHCYRAHVQQTQRRQQQQQQHVTPTPNRTPPHRRLVSVPTVCASRV